MVHDDTVRYSSRPEWADVTPCPQDDGPDPVVPIAYSEEFREAMDYFRAILQKNERSERAFQLTSDVIEFNAANYTAWQYRRLLIEELKKDLHAELDYTREAALNTPKNYQIWYHRRAIMERLRQPEGELAFVAEVLADDAKNYHAWSYRQWLLKEFNLWDGELAFLNELLLDDVRNNSAWNQRHFVISNTTGFTKEVITLEIQYCIVKIQLATKNESVWNYLRGVLLGHRFAEFPEVKAACLKLLAESCRSTFLHAFLLDIYTEEGDKEAAIKTCELLANEIDVIRVAYWQYRRDLLSGQ